MGIGYCIVIPRALPLEYHYTTGFYLEILVWGGRGHGTFTHSSLFQTIDRIICFDINLEECYLRVSS